MIRIITIWELLVLSALVLLVGRELVALLQARRKGLTRNVSREVTFSTLLALAVGYGALAVRWLNVDVSIGTVEDLHRLPLANWGHLVLLVMIIVILTYELTALVYARGSGLTSNVTRLVSFSASILMLLVLLGMSEIRWDLYFERRLEAVQLTVPMAEDSEPGADSVE